MPSYKIGITVHLNPLLAERLSNAAPDNESSYADKVLSEYFGITYEEAYPNCKKNKWIGFVDKT